MKSILRMVNIGIIGAAILLLLSGCSNMGLKGVKIPTPITGIAILLRHSTGGYLFNYGYSGDHNDFDDVDNPTESGVGSYFRNYNQNNDTNYTISKRAFPGDGYSWDNYPYDYWNIFVENGDSQMYSGQETLKALSEDYGVIIWKHCWPGSEIEADSGSPDITSSVRSLENYKLQYEALKTEMLEYPATNFIVWTLALETEGLMGPGERTRSKEFVDWVRDAWDESGDNIYLWDMYYLETNKESVQYLAYPSSDSHPSSSFNEAAGPLFAQRVIDVIEGHGDTALITGETGNVKGDQWNLTP